LLGCVEVVDIISNEKYKQIIEEKDREESDCEFLFVCKNPQRLIVPQQLSGQHKICMCVFCVCLL
jgi:hypothetical protein